jgi:transposase
MKAYSEDLRAKIIKQPENGVSALEEARNFGVHVRTVDRYWSRYQSSGQAYCKLRGGYRVSVLNQHREVIKKWIKTRKDITLEEIRSRLRRAVCSGTYREHIELSYPQDGLHL